MSSQSTWFITGTSRGIGLQFVKQLIAKPDNVVVASCRNPDSASELKSLQAQADGRLHIIPLDVTDEATIKAAAESTAQILGVKGLDYLLNNAAINPGDDGAFDLKLSDLQDALQSNLFGPLLISQAFLPLLEKGRRKVVLNMTSGLASVGLNIGSKCASYSISKAALNMLTYKQSTQRPDIISFVVDPGWVKTKMGGAGAFLEPQESVTPLLVLLERATHECSGKFFNREGNPIPW